MTGDQNKRIKERLEALWGKRDVVALHSFACDCLRLCVNFLEEPAAVLQILTVAKQYQPNPPPDYSEGGSSNQPCPLPQHLVSPLEELDFRNSHGPVARLAGIPGFAYTFATLAFAIYDELSGARLELSLGNHGPMEKAMSRIQALFAGPSREPSLLERNYPLASQKLDALLDGPECGKARERLSVFYAFTVHGSYRHVAVEQARLLGEVIGTPDHSIPASRVKMLGQSLGLQLTQKFEGPGRPQTVLTDAGKALLDWLNRHFERVF